VQKNRGRRGFKKNRPPTEKFKGSQLGFKGEELKVATKNLKLHTTINQRVSMRGMGEAKKIRFNRQRLDVEFKRSDIHQSALNLGQAS